jgi:hypothetical protein
MLFVPFCVALGTDQVNDMYVNEKRCEKKVLSGLKMLFWAIKI